jgi:hypothetical protein
MVCAAGRSRLSIDTVRLHNENRSVSSTGREDGTEDRPDHERAIQVALAEFAALRAEIMGRISTVATLIGIGLTSLGVVVGFAVKEDGDVRLLLAVPPLAMLVNVLLSIEHRRITLAGAYIRGPLWTILRQHTGHQLPCWEDEVQRRRSGVASADLGGVRWSVDRCVCGGGRRRDLGVSQ